MVKRRGTMTRVARLSTAAHSLPGIALILAGLVLSAPSPDSSSSLRDHSSPAPSAPPAALAMEGLFDSPVVPDRRDDFRSRSSSRLSLDQMGILTYCRTARVLFVLLRLPVTGELVASVMHWGTANLARAPPTPIA
jgi:hypothetical protein